MQPTGLPCQACTGTVVGTEAHLSQLIHLPDRGLVGDFFQSLLPLSWPWFYFRGAPQPWKRWAPPKA